MINTVSNWLNIASTQLQTLQNEKTHGAYSMGECELIATNGLNHLKGLPPPNALPYRLKATEHYFKSVIKLSQIYHDAQVNDKKPLIKDVVYLCQKGFDYFKMLY
jgi:hypothetical protein